MKKINGIFILFVFLIGFMSIIYIWKAEDEKTELEVKMVQQADRIDSLNKQLVEAKIDNKQQLFGDVKGTETTAIGTISGTISGESIDENTIVCATEQTSKQDYCTDELTEVGDVLEYSLEIPIGKYSLYASTPPNAEKSYFSNITDCFEDEECQKEKIMRFIELLDSETQSDINIIL